MCLVFRPVGWTVYPPAFLLSEISNQFKIDAARNSSKANKLIGEGSIMAAPADSASAIVE